MTVSPVAAVCAVSESIGVLLLWWLPLLASKCACILYQLRPIVQHLGYLNSNQHADLCCTSTVLALAVRPFSAPTARLSHTPATLCFLVSLPAAGVLLLLRRKSASCGVYVR